MPFNTTESDVRCHPVVIWPCLLEGTQTHHCRTLLALLPESLSSSPTQHAARLPTEQEKEIQDSPSCACAVLCCCLREAQFYV